MAAEAGKGMGIDAPVAALGQAEEAPIAEPFVEGPNEQHSEPDVERGEAAAQKAAAAAPPPAAKSMLSWLFSATAILALLVILFVGLSMVESSRIHGGSSRGSTPASPMASASAPAEEPPRFRGGSSSSGGTPAPPTASTSAPPEVQQAAGKCYNVFAQMDVNALQAYPDNPDSEASGFANCKLCTSGDMHCTSMLNSGTSRIIAAHIHDASNDDGATGEGPPVINFCGDNREGLINDGTGYMQPCNQWLSGTSHNADMPGALVASQNVDMTLKQRVEDIAANPERYYLNFHSLASFNHWYPRHNGMSRGQLQFQSVDA